jgi:RHS repeat-associated protein
VANFVYEDGSLSYILTGEGRILVSSEYYTYEYHLKDHLGNTRVTFTDDDDDGVISASEIRQVSDYYPFGMLHSNSANLMNGNQKYLYNGKELQEGTDWYDYGARMYDPQIGRWHCIDPYTEDYAEVGAYVYALNNPIRFIDPDGEKVKLSFAETGIQAGFVYGAGAFYQWGTAKDDYGKTWYSTANAKFLNPDNDGNFEFFANIDFIEGGFIQSKNDKSFSEFLSQSWLSVNLGPIDFMFNDHGVTGISGGISVGLLLGSISANLQKSYSVTYSEAAEVKHYAGINPDVDNLSIKHVQIFNGELWVNDPNNGYLIIQMPLEDPVDTGIRMTKVGDNQWESREYNKNKENGNKEKVNSNQDSGYGSYSKCGGTWWFY